MNDEGAPTWSNGRGSTSVINLLFISDRLCNLEPLVEVSMDNRGRSDHALLTCLFGSQLRRPGKPYIPKDSEEEDEFCYFMGTTLAAIPSLGEDLDVEETATGLSRLLTDKWNSLAKMPITSRPHGASWWNVECQAYRDAYNLVRSKENLKAYNAVTRKARTAFFEEKIAIASLTHTTTILCKKIVLPTPPSLLFSLAISSSCAHISLLCCSLSLSSEHGPQ